MKETGDNPSSYRELWGEEKNEVMRKLLIDPLGRCRDQGENVIFYEIIIQ